MAALVLAVLAVAWCYRDYDHQRIKVSHTITPGEDHAPFGPDGAFTLQVSNHGWIPAHDLVVEVVWPGMTVGIMGGDAATLKEGLATFQADELGFSHCRLKELLPGRAVMLMFNARKIKGMGAVPPQPTAVHVHGQGFTSHWASTLPVGLPDH